MNVLITGSNGFVGKHLEAFLKTKDLNVMGVDLPTDLKILEIVDDIIYQKKPDYIFHLAAKAYVPSSFDDPQDVLVNNIIPAVNIFQTIKKYGLSTKVQVASSSEQYGKVNPNEVPITEANELREMSPYAISKTAMDKLAQWYVNAYKLNIFITRGFNHSGPGRGEQYVTSTFAKQIAEIEVGKREYLSVGNLEAKRDFTDVRDMVRAYWLAVNKCIPGEPYNICSGKAYSIQEILNKLLAMSTQKNIEIRTDPSRMRVSDVPILYGDCSKFKQATGWEPEIDIDTTLKDLLDYWRKLI